MNAKAVELHLIQSFPPSCVNRDGNNSPKDCTFGDYRRARISSQCFKRAIRETEIFAETIDDGIGIRSKRFFPKVVKYLNEKEVGDAEKKAEEFLSQLANFDTKKGKLNITDVGLYFGTKELFQLLDAFRQGDKKWKEKGTAKSADVALFGRMLTKATDLSVNAAAQVAHAISTHKLSQEFDYWTAADDLKDTAAGEDAGAGMLGTAEFNASVFYRYHCINIPVLEKNLEADSELPRKTIEAFLLAAHDAIPTGKLNGHAHFTPPVAALAVVRRRGMPINLANAFLNPVRPIKNVGIDEQSYGAMLIHLGKMRKMAPVDQAVYIATSIFDGKDLEGDIMQVDGYADLIKKVLEELS